MSVELSIAMSMAATSAAVTRPTKQRSVLSKLLGMDTLVCTIIAKPAIRADKLAGLEFKRVVNGVKLMWIVNEECNSFSATYSFQLLCFLIYFPPGVLYFQNRE
jgi:hypothetical protein